MKPSDCCCCCYGGCCCRWACVLLARSQCCTAGCCSTTIKVMIEMLGRSWRGQRGVEERRVAADGARVMLSYRCEAAVSLSRRALQYSCGGDGGNVGQRLRAVMWWGGWCEGCVRSVRGSLSLAAYVAIALATTSCFLSHHKNPHNTERQQTTNRLVCCGVAPVQHHSTPHHIRRGMASCTLRLVALQLRRGLQQVAASHAQQHGQVTSRWVQRTFRAVCRACSGFRRVGRLRER